MSNKATENIVVKLLKEQVHPVILFLPIYKPCAAAKAKATAPSQRSFSACRRGNRA